MAFDKAAQKKKLRQGAIVQGGNQPRPVPVMSNQQTVIYTIPTTRQLSQQYPQIVGGYPHHTGQNNSPPAYAGKSEDCVKYPGLNT